MANIGLVTFSQTLDNYGQVLQALATQKYLQGRGHDVFLLRRDAEFSEVAKHQLKRFVATLLLKLHIVNNKEEVLKKLSGERKRQQKALYSEKEHPRNFEEFRQQNFKIIHADNSNLKKHNINVLCTGSDQIWSGKNTFFFLRFAGHSFKRIAIAPSTGNRANVACKESKITKWLHDYSFITTREDSGVKFCKINGYSNVRKILDPTFLMDKQGYDVIASSEFHTNEYIFVYLLNSCNVITYSDISAFAKSHELEIIYVTGQGLYDKNKKVYASIPEWLSLLRDASYVITNSFHGMAMSIVYKKKFLVLPLTGMNSKTNERVTNVLGEMGLDRRVYSNNLDQLLEEIDYGVAEKKIKENRRILDDLMLSVEL